MDDPPPAACEVCVQGPLTRVFRPVPVFFKGSGFYTTDYGRGKRKVESASDSSGDGGKTSETSTKTSEPGGEKGAKAAES